MSDKRSTSWLLAALAAILVAAPAAADNAWGNYQWARTTPSFSLLVIDSVTAAWDEAFDGSIERWSESGVLDLSVTKIQEGKRHRRRCGMVDGQLRVCNAAYGKNGWLGLATIGIDKNGHIDRGTALLNDTYASYWALFGERNHVACQEIGHVLGLHHTSEDGSSQGTCMDYSSDPASQWPNQHDYFMLDLIYAHLDSYNSYDTGDDGGDGGGGGGGCNAPPGKGCNKRGAKRGAGLGPPTMGVRVHADRDHEVWVASRGDGGLWVHHMRLAP